MIPKIGEQPIENRVSFLDTNYYLLDKDTLEKEIKEIANNVLNNKSFKTENSKKALASLIKDNFVRDELCRKLGIARFSNFSPAHPAIIRKTYRSNPTKKN